MKKPELTTGRIQWHTAMSLDGYVAEPAEKRSCVFRFDWGTAPTASRMADRLGALIVGRRTMDVEDRNRPGFYGGAYRGPFFMLTHDTDRPAPVVKGVQGTNVNVPITQAVALAREAAKGKDVALLGANVASQALEAGLVDGIVVHVVPILLGDGVPLYRGAPRDLTLVTSRREGDIVTLELTPRVERQRSQTA
jgi:dihydrofolate reductase